MARMAHATPCASCAAPAAVHLHDERLAARNVALLAQLPHAYAQLGHATGAEARAAAFELVDDGVELAKIRRRRRQQLADARDLWHSVVEVELRHLRHEVRVALILQRQELLELLVQEPLHLHRFQQLLLVRGDRVRHGARPGPRGGLPAFFKLSAGLRGVGVCDARPS